MSEQQYIIRNKTKENFTIIPNSMLQDDRLSWKARGLLSYMVSLPDDWVIYEIDLANRSQKDAITSVRSAMKELKEFGYVKKEAIRDAETNKIVKWVTYVSSSPDFYEPDLENLQCGKPSDRETYILGNRTLQRTNNTNNTSLQKNNDTNINSRPPQDNTKEFNSEPSRTLSDDDEKLRQLLKVVQENIKPSVTPIEQQAMEYWVKDYDYDLIKEAVRRTIMNGSRRMSYTETILRDWDGKGIKSAEELEYYEANNQNKRGNYQQQQEKQAPRDYNPQYDY